MKRSSLYFALSLLLVLGGISACKTQEILYQSFCNLHRIVINIFTTVTLFASLLSE